MTEFLQRRPAVRFALLLTGGILFAESVPIHSIPTYFIAAALFAAGVAMYVRAPGHPSVSVALHACVVTLGIVLHTHNRERSYESTLEPKYQGERIRIQGTLEAEPALQGSHYRFVVDCRIIERNGRRMMGRRRAVVSVPKSKWAIEDTLHPGSAVHIEGILEKMPFQRNPGEFDFGKYLSLNDVQGVVSVTDTDGVRSEHSSVRSFATGVVAAQKQLYGIIDRFHPAVQSSFIKGIVLGYRAEIPSDVKQSFMDTGTIHILAVSGSNVAAVALICYSIFGLLRLPRLAMAAAAVGSLLFYMLVTGSSPSVVRATIMAIIIVVGASAERKADVYNSLAVSAIVLLLFDTGTLFDVGFQLSYAAVLSIIYFYPFLVQLIKKIPERYEEIKGIDSVLKLFAVSLAAQLGTIPFTAYYFGRVSMISLLANLVVVPLSGLNTILGFTTIAFSFLGGFVAQCYAALNNVLVTFLLGFVKVSASVPFAYLETTNTGLPAAAFYYVVVISIFNVTRPAFARRALICLLAVGNAALWWGLLSNQRPLLRVTAIDVGQGDALLLEFPNKKTMLLDAGPYSRGYDSGEKIIAPFLQRRGIRTIDALVLSHPHSDHFGGMSYIVRHYSIGGIIEGCSVQDSGLYANFKSTAGERHVPLGIRNLGDQILIDTTARMYVLHPHFPDDSSRNYNNVSLVVKLVYGSTAMLLTGDAETETEEKLLRRYGKFLSCEVLKAGHHGSKTSSGDKFLSAANPAMSIISVGMNNKFHHPSNEVITRMNSLREEVFRTDNEGAVMVESDGKEWKRVEWRRRR